MSLSAAGYRVRYRLRSNRERLALTQKGWHEMKWLILLCSGKVTMNNIKDTKTNEIKLKACIVTDYYSSKFGPRWGSRWLGGGSYCPSSWTASKSDDFGGSPFPISSHWPHHSSIPPIKTVFILGHMHCNTVVDVTPHHPRLCFVCHNVLRTRQCTLHLLAVLPWYTMPFFFSSGTCNFPLVGTCLKVIAVVKALWMLRGTHIFSSLSLSPWMYCT